MFYRAMEEVKAFGETSKKTKGKVDLKTGTIPKLLKLDLSLFLKQNQLQLV